MEEALQSGDFAHCFLSSNIECANAIFKIDSIFVTRGTIYYHGYYFGKNFTAKQG